MDVHEPFDADAYQRHQALQAAPSSRTPELDAVRRANADMGRRLADVTASINKGRRRPELAILVLLVLVVGVSALLSLLIPVARSLSLTVAVVVALLVSIAVFSATYISRRLRGVK
jgi:hypothetical protein